MQVSEQQLRTLTLAQAIERTDTDHALVSQADLDAATRSALAAARQRGMQRPEVQDIALERAAAVVARAGAAEPSVTALHPPSTRLRWLARALPVVTLVLGLAVDRIANAHRMDLLSPPLLLVLGWNLVMYTLLAVGAWRARRPRTAAHHWQQTLRRWARPAVQARAGRRGLAARIAADFYSHWFAQTADLFTQRAARVMHLCAAAWAAGLALSLLLRGLVVRYQFGWESTFLDAGQVHAITTVLFWPITALFGLAPFSLQDIVATQDFAGHGAAGGRWVGMYVGLLALVVVVPRLALAGWARWRERQLAGQRSVDLADPAFDSLRRSMPCDLVLGLVAGPAHMAAWRGILAAHTTHAEPDTLETTQGDRLRFVDASSPEAHQPVDAVIQCIDSASAAPLAAAWRAAPQITLRWAEFGESWVREPALFDHLATTLPDHQPALARLRQAWVEHNEWRFEQSIGAVAEHLRACARLSRAHSDDAGHYAQRAQTLDAALRALHTGSTPVHPTAPAPQTPPSPGEPSGDPAPRVANPASLAPRHIPTGRGADGTALALGTSAGAAAGAAAGAKVGALIDLGTGGMTLGAGTALGALLGGTTAWVVRSLQKKDATEDVLRHITEAACTHYLVIAHQDRVPEQDAAHTAGRWQAEVTGTVAAHWTALATALQATPPAAAAAGTPADPLPPLLRTMLMGILRRSSVPGVALGADSDTPGSASR